MNPTVELKLGWPAPHMWQVEPGMIRVRHIMAALPAAAFTLLPHGSNSVQAAEDDGISYAVPYAGVDSIADSTFFYSGAIVALEPHPNAKSNILIHGFAGRGEFTYPSVIAPDGEVDGILTWLRGTVGYQTNAGNLRLTGHVGIDYQDYDLTPNDPGNLVNGSETGFFVSGDIETINPKPLFFSAIGQYSTAYEWYWTRVRTGYAIGQGDYAFQKVIFGPEGSFFGNIGFDAQRAGGFLSFPVKLGSTPLSITLSGGYQWVGDDEEGGQVVGGIGGVGDTAYGSLNINAVF